MKRKPDRSIWLASLLLLVASLACGGLGAPAPTEAPTDTSAPPTATKRPTSTPRPSATPNIAATKEMQEAQANVKRYVDSGYLATSNGDLFTLKDSTREMAKKNYLDYEDAGYNDPAKNFAVWVDVKWSSAGPVNYPEFSGCGFLYRYDQSNGNYYSVMLTNDSILMTYCVSALHGCGRVGKTKGTGKVSFGNPAQAKLEMAVNENHAYVLVDGNFIGEYTLFTDKLMEPGFLGYSIISGTNKDYGTRCEFTNGKIWIPNQ